MPTTLHRSAPLIPPALRATVLARVLCLLLATVIVVELFVLGSRPAAAGLFTEPWDKLAHAAVFAAITGLLWIGTAGRMPLTVVGILVFVSALDELHQAGLPGRTADALDFLVDVCAGAAMIGLISLVTPARTTRRSPSSLPPRKRRRKD